MTKRIPKLLSRFGFWRGAASAFDLFGTSFDIESFVRNDRSDAEALASDWEAIGEDFDKAINQFCQENGIEKFKTPNKKAGG